MTFGQRVEKIRKEKGLTQDELAKKVGYTSRSTISKIEKDERDVPRSTVTILAEALGVKPSALMGWEDEKIESNDENDNILSYSNVIPIKKIRLPLLGEIACGQPIFADEQHELYIDVENDYGADFCLKANGESMINAGIDSGDIVLIRKTSMVNNGEIAAVIIDDEATLKRVYYYPEKGKLILNPENPSFEPLVYINEELNTIQIIGKAVAILKKI